MPQRAAPNTLAGRGRGVGWCRAHPGVGGVGGQGGGFPAKAGGSACQLGLCGWSFAGGDPSRRPAREPTTPVPMTDGDEWKRGRGAQMSE